MSFHMYVSLISEDLIFFHLNQPTNKLLARRWRETGMYCIFGMGLEIMDPTIDFYPEGEREVGKK